MASAVTARWTGDFPYLVSNLLLKDFRVRYRNMSLGFGWSIASPLVMMGVLTFIFTRVFPNGARENFPAFVLCGLVPFNFFSTSWVLGTISLIDNAGLIKRTTFPREIVPVASVLANTLHFAIQIGLLLTLCLWSGYKPTWAWLWLPIVAAFEVLFVCGLALMFSAFDVLVRDTRYLVESANVLLFWMVPIFYDFNIIPKQYVEIYRLNPVAAVVMAFRNILLEGRAPADSLMLRLALVSTLVLAVGFFCFGALKRKFYDYL
jgi:lipopolysaccharide transport system permease protein